jgi:tRNA pseudouridine55 synthase
MPDLNGIFNIDKPKGLTSHDVVARVRRLIRAYTREASTQNHALERSEGSKRKTQDYKVGHAGTLDPMATGVLPVVVGNATRLVEYLADADKAYRAQIILGATSDTYDAEGTITPTPGDPPLPTRNEVESSLDAFRGEIAQLPPMHSAIKVGGKKLYELARRGEEIEREPRLVTIKRLDLEVYRPPHLQLFVECSKGTYIRSLAHDLGASLGTGAYLSGLVRTRHGPFTLDGATTLEGLEAAFNEGTWPESLYPPDYILQGWPTHSATPEEELDIRQGKPLSSPAIGGEEMMAAYTQEGALLAILYRDPEREIWRPRKVFAVHSQ